MLVGFPGGLPSKNVEFFPGHQWAVGSELFLKIFKGLKRLYRALRSSGPRELSFFADSDVLVGRTDGYKGATPLRLRENVK